MKVIKPTLFKVVVNGAPTEVFLYHLWEGRFVCYFDKDDKKHDFVNSYDAFGFNITITNIGKKDIFFSPIKLRRSTKLAEAIMKDVWMQIEKEMKVS